MCTIILSWGGGGVKGAGTLTTYHHLVPRLRINGYIPLLHLYTLMVWTGTTLLFNFAYTLSVSVTSGHFVPTSNSLSWYTVLSKLEKGVVPWVNFLVFHFAVLTGLKSFKCCTFLWQMALKW